MPANKLLSYPHDVFLMLRFEFMAICQDELEAKVLRIIEMYVEGKRRQLFAEAVNQAHATPEQVIDIEKDIWVPISHRLFINDLYGTVTSENGLKRALKSLQEKKLIFMQFDPKRRYDAPEYRLHTSVLQSLLDLVGQAGYQKLIPSVIDTLKKLHPQELTPSGCQQLILSVKDSSTTPETRVSENDTNYNKCTDNTDNKVSSGGEDTEESNSTPAPPAHTHSFSSSQEKTEARSGAKQTPPPGKPSAKTAHTPEAEAIRALYDSIALGPGKLSGHPKWDWTAMEEMVAAHPTEEEIRLVYLHLKAKQQVDIRQKCTIQAIWENWSALGTLKKPVFSNSSPPSRVIVNEEPERPFLKPSDTHKPRYGSLAAVGGGR